MAQTSNVQNSRQERFLGVVQPTYLPWLPFFERMAAADVFIYLDDVEYTKNGFLNRNAIKTRQGRLLLTVPVSYKGASNALINEIGIENRLNWAKKHWRSIEQNYSKSPFWGKYQDELGTLINTPRERLIELIIPLIEFFKREFQITTPSELSSQSRIASQRNEKLIALCQKFDASHFIVKPSTEDYHPPKLFRASGIDMAYLEYSNPVYGQLFGSFEPGLSALDYLLNCGPGIPPFAAEVTNE